MKYTVITGALLMGLALTGVCLHAGVPKKVIDRFEAGEQGYSDENGEQRTMLYRLLKPPMVRSDKEYPLVLFLHGAGERGDDNLAQLKYLPTWLSQPQMRRKYPCYLIALQCPKNRRWGSIDWSKEQYDYADEPMPEMRAVMQILKRVTEKHPVDRNRIYLTGLSMGGYGTWELATRKPEWFAAAAPICGGGDPDRVRPLVDLPLWAWHGEADQAVPVERSRRMIEAIRATGGDPKFTELPNVGHNAWTPAYQRKDGLLPWLFKQKRGAD